MSTIQQTLNQKICEDMTQVQVDLEGALQKIFQQADSKINPERQEEITQAIENTKQLLERFKSKYIDPIVSNSANSLNSVEDKGYYDI